MNETEDLAKVVMENSSQCRGHEVLEIASLRFQRQQGEGMTEMNVLEEPQSMTWILSSRHFCEYFVTEMMRMNRQHHFHIPKQSFYGK